RPVVGARPERAVGRVALGRRDDAELRIDADVGGIAVAPAGARAAARERGVIRTYGETVLALVADGADEQFDGLRDGGGRAGGRRRTRVRGGGGLVQYGRAGEARELVDTQRLGRSGLVGHGNAVAAHQRGGDRRREDDRADPGAGSASAFHDV